MADKTREKLRIDRQSAVNLPVTTRLSILEAIVQKHFAGELRERLRQELALLNKVENKNE